MSKLPDENSDQGSSDKNSDQKIAQLLQPQEQQQKQSKIGKPRGMGNQKPLDKTGEWCSQTKQIKLLQIFQRQGRFVYFQSTGIKANQDNNLQDQTCCNFLNEKKTIQIAQTVAEICQIKRTNNKNCVIFFFQPQPKIKIEEDKLILQDEVGQNIIEPLKKIAPMLSDKFLCELVSYLNCEAKNDEIKNFFEDQNNLQLQTAHTLLQAQFVKFLVRDNQNSEEQIQKIKDKETQKEKYEERYQEFYGNAFEDFQQTIQEIWACMYDDENDRQYDQ